MHRILFQLGPLTIFSYGAMLVVAFLAATWLASRDARRLPPGRAALTHSQIVDVFCLVMLSGVVGARLFFVAQHWQVYVRYPHEIPAIWYGGLIWYGGFAGGLLAAVTYLRLQRIPFWRGADQCIPYVPLAHAIGRIGCFLNGCCYGKPTTAWYGVTFPGKPGPVIPTQLMEAGLLALLFLGLRRLQQGQAFEKPGQLFSLYLVAYGVIRFVLEFLRGDQELLWGGLTLQQLVSLGVLLGGLLLLASRVGAGRSRPVT